MEAEPRRYRPKGTGSVVFEKGRRWVAYSPSEGHRKGSRIGRFEYRKDAEAALEKWLEQNLRDSGDALSVLGPAPVLR